MKKIYVFLLTALFMLTLGGCSYIRHTSGSSDNGNALGKADVAFGEKISGSATSTRVFGIIKLGLPKNYADGANHVTSESRNQLNDPFSPEKKAAVYDAVSKSNAEFIDDPEFVVEKKNYLLFSKIKVSVNGYKNKHIIAKAEEPPPVVVAAESKIQEAAPTPAPASAETAATTETKQPEAVVAAPHQEVPVAPVETATATPVNVVNDKPVQVSSQKEGQNTPEEEIKILVNKWLAAWQSGDMETYRACYATDFRSKGKDLNNWISYKTELFKKSNDIKISIDNLKIKMNKENVATAVFTQNYSSSVLKDSGKKTLKLIKVNNKWKIFKEFM